MGNCLTLLEAVNEGFVCGTDNEAGMVQGAGLEAQGNQI